MKLYLRIGQIFFFSDCLPQQRLLLAFWEAVGQKRIKLGWFSWYHRSIYVGLFIHIVGSWQWGGGFLSNTWRLMLGGFHDFAGLHGSLRWDGQLFESLLYIRDLEFGSSAKMEKPKCGIPGHNILWRQQGVFLSFGWRWFGI